MGMSIGGVIVWAVATRRPARHRKPGKPPSPALRVPPVVSQPPGKCGACPWRTICTDLVHQGLPVLCERLTEKEAETMREAMKAMEAMEVQG